MPRKSIWVISVSSSLGDGVFRSLRTIRRGLWVHQFQGHRVPSAVCRGVLRRQCISKVQALLSDQPNRGLLCWPVDVGSARNMDCVGLLTPGTSTLVSAPKTLENDGHGAAIRWPPQDASFIRHFFQPERLGQRALAPIVDDGVHFPPHAHVEELHARLPSCLSAGTVRGYPPFLSARALRGGTQRILRRTGPASCDQDAHHLGGDSAGAATIRGRGRGTRQTWIHVEQSGRCGDGTVQKSWDIGSTTRSHCHRIGRPADRDRARTLPTMFPPPHSNPCNSDMKSLKHLLTYIRGTMDMAMVHSAYMEHRLVRLNAMHQARSPSRLDADSGGSDIWR